MTKSKTVKFSIHLIKDSPKASIERKKGYFPAAIPADLRVNFYRNRDIDPSVPILSSSRCPRWKGCAAQLSYFPPNNPLLVFSPLTPFSRPNNPSNAARGTTEGSIFIGVLYETLSLSLSLNRATLICDNVCIALMENLALLHPLFSSFLITFRDYANYAGTIPTHPWKVKRSTRFFQPFYRNNLRGGGLLLAFMTTVLESDLVSLWLWRKGFSGKWEVKSFRLVFIEEIVRTRII